MNRTSPSEDERKARLAAALRENLKRRKEQARARRAAPRDAQGDTTPDADKPRG